MPQSVQPGTGSLAGPAAPAGSTDLCDWLLSGSG